MTTTDHHLESPGDLSNVDLPACSPSLIDSVRGEPTSRGHAANTDVDTRMHANKYVIATQLSKEELILDELCKKERDDLIKRLICPQCRGGPYKHERSLRRHYKIEDNTCGTIAKAEDPNRERKKENLQAAKRLADPIAYNARAAKRQTYYYKDEIPEGYDTYEEYAHDKARGMFCGGTCKD